LTDYYDKYVQKGYNMGGLEAPDKGTWIQELPKLSNAGKLTEEYYFPSTNHKQAMDTEAGAIQALDQIHYGGVKLSKMAAQSMLGLGHLFHITSDEDYKNLKQNIDQVAQQRIDRISQDSTNEATFWLQAHPSKSWTGKIDSFIGENLVQLPFWEAIGSARVGVIGVTTLKAPEVGKVANLTKWLATNGMGKFVANRLDQATDAFLGSVLSGQGEISTLINTMFAPTLGGIADINSYRAANQIANVSKQVIKGWMGKTIAIGGRPLVDVIENQAAHELSSFVIAKTSDGGEIKLVPESRESGHIEANGLKVPYKTLGEQQNLVSKILQNHKQVDPVHFNLINTGKATLSQLAQERYGKTFAELNKGQQLNVRKQFRKLASEATDELPLHNPDFAKTHIDNQLAEDAKQNPKLAQRIAEAEAASGIKVSSALQEDEATKIEKQTGIQNSQAVASKVKTVKNPVQLSKATKIAREEEPRKYVQFKVDSLSYLKNYAKKFKGEASKGLTSELRDMDEPREFSRALQEQMGAGDIRFENEKHALLWANQFRDQLPKPFQKQLQNALHEANPGEYQRDWDEQSKNLANHMEDLAQTGRLFSQGNVFRSTQVEQWTNQTAWQRQLQKEVEDVELARLQKVLYRYPEIKKSAVQLTKQLQKARRMSENAGTYKYISDEIRREKTIADWKRVMRVKDK